MKKFFTDIKKNGEILSGIFDMASSNLKGIVDGISIHEHLDKLSEKANDFKDLTTTAISGTAKHIKNKHSEYNKQFSTYRAKTQREILDKSEKAFKDATQIARDYGKVAKTQISFYADKILKICITTVIGFVDVVKAVLNYSNEHEDAFKFKLEEAKKNAVHVGIWDEQETPLAEIQIQSPLGVAKGLKNKNDWYYIHDYC